MSEDDAHQPHWGRRLWVIIPALIFAGLALLFYIRLDQLREHPNLASDIPSALLGKHVPAFSLPALEGTQRPAARQTDLEQGHFTLVNIFGSWCVPCRQEHPLLMKLSDDADLKAVGFEVIGLAYKDEPKNALAFLMRNGNPYARIGVDLSGRAAIDWGAYGVPESFLVRGDGVIVRKYIGPLTAINLETDLRALVLHPSASAP
jgi:cytochrome c biogenesis protein CcmG, thiol:disulfide interchange protein DsbE